MPCELCHGHGLLASVSRATVVHRTRLGQMPGRMPAWATERWPWSPAQLIQCQHGTAAGRPRDPRRPATGVRGRPGVTHALQLQRAWWSGLVVACLTGGSAARHDRCPSSPCRVTPFVAPVPSLAGCELRRASLGKPRKLGGSPTGRRILDAKSGRKRPFAPFRDIFLSARFVCI
jgi:hypothetical protein